MNKIAFAFAFAVLASFAFAATVQEEMAARTEAREWTAPDGGVFRYRWHEPSTTETGKVYPLVILMHGAGERGTNNVAQLQWGAKPLFDYLDGRKQAWKLIPTGCSPKGNDR